MHTIFIEYRIIPYVKSEFLHTHTTYVRSKASQAGKNYRFLKGTDQQDIFVEMLDVDKLDIYQQWKKQLATNDPALPWSAIIPYIAGGQAKLHMWAFQEPTLGELFT